MSGINTPKNGETQSMKFPHLGGPPPAPLKALGRFTMSIDCDGLLSNSSDDDGVMVAKEGSAAIQHFQLDSLMGVAVISGIKVKVYHICGEMKVSGRACLIALWQMGDWFVEEYGKVGIIARYEKLVDGRGRDWDEADATLIVYITRGTGLGTGLGT
ncbi:hypothetical protein EJ04DRAFT_558005 [Polyplosphaeria fusca]|uniref:Uncharacterized protein n=1 Tax=Polyplosphaeria fusca TaxID=682080 RepID=A0A9P4RD18_9PLEO|nr:hypothetical protein EJ04DRAFT_558005 [Polyplosphaeria fusca]